MHSADLLQVQESVGSAGGHGGQSWTAGRKTRTRGHERAALVRRRTDAKGPPGSTTGWGVLAALIALAVSTPTILAVSVMAGLPHDIALALGATWSLVQIPILVYVVHRHRPVSTETPPDDSDLLSLGARAVKAEAALRRDQERLHELRATVAGIGMTYRLMRDRRGHLSVTTRSRLEHLYESELERLERLLGDQPRGALETLDVAGAIDPLVESLRLHGQVVSWTGPQAFARGRYDDIVEIVHILLENAVRHAPGSEISVRVEAAGPDVRVHVQDHGSGVPPALAPHVFERGVRSEDSPGEGIGLHVAQRLAREMGGELRLDAPVRGRGAAFTVTLPAAGADACLVRSH